MRLHRAFIRLDAGLIEINPLALTDAGESVAIDAKLAIDDNAMFRHPDLAELGRDAESDFTSQLHAQRHPNQLRADGWRYRRRRQRGGAGLPATLDAIPRRRWNARQFHGYPYHGKEPLDIALGRQSGAGQSAHESRVGQCLRRGMQPCDTIHQGLGSHIGVDGACCRSSCASPENNEDSARLRLANFSLPSTECPGHAAGGDTRRRDRAGEA